MLYGCEDFLGDLSGAYVQDVIYLKNIQRILSIRSENNFYHIGIAGDQQIIYFSPLFNEFEM